ncbi:MAG: ABC transporter permease [Ruminococcaceae bacterium]|nr:ABC transporter permease [Oscillospiraceae bacterium]
MNKITHEPLFHISKRNTIVWWKAWIIRVTAILAALIVCGFVTLALTGLNPLAVYATMFEGALGTTRRIWNLLQNVAVLLCVALAVTPAFKMKFWNLGAEGQVLIGGLATEVCMIFLGNKLPTPLLILVMVITSVIAGAVWGLIPAFFKANWETNESLFTLMMNYVAIQIVSYFTFIWSVPKGSGTPRVLEYGQLPVIAGQKYLLNIIIVAVLTVIMFVYLKYTKQGYEISVVGGSPNTARYIGINVKKVIIRTMLISGAICGLAGLILVAGTDHSLKSTTAGGRGFTAIMVSWLAKFDPIFMVLTSFLIVFLEKGASKISEVYRLNDSFSDIITGIIIFFIIGSEFFINYKLKFNKSNNKEAER